MKKHILFAISTISFINSLLAMDAGKFLFEAVDFEAFLESELNVNAEDTNGILPLHKAVAANKKSLSLKLLKAKANPNGIVLRTGPKDEAPKELKDSTALHLASFMGRKGIVGILLKYGAQINSRGYKGITPLHIAVQMMHKGVVRTLLDHGADTTLLSEGLTPLGKTFAVINSLDKGSQNAFETRSWEALLANEKLRMIIRMLIEHDSEHASINGQVSEPVLFPEFHYIGLLWHLSPNEHDKWRDSDIESLIDCHWGECKDFAYISAEVKISPWALKFLIEVAQENQDHRNQELIEYSIAEKEDIPPLERANL